jgi:lipopolysaccharide transport system permease protein
MSEPLLVIRPPRGLASLNLGEVLAYREIVQTFAMREIKLRYRQTALGMIWVVLQPLLTAGIGSFIFGQLAGFAHGDGVGYFVRTYAGQLAWGVFGLAIFKIHTSLVGNAPMLSKVFFPRLTLPLASAVAALMDFLIGLALMLVLLVVTGTPLTLAILTLPLWVLMLSVFALGIGMMAAALMVSYRDVGFVLPVVLTSLQQLSPVYWPLAELSRHAPTWLPPGAYLALNPVAPLIEGMRWSLTGGQLAVAPGWVGYSCAWALVALALGILIFRTEERRFADVV